jgi:large subunit ribosomal protein L41e
LDGILLILTANIYKANFSPCFMKRSSRRWKKKRQMRWKWQRKRLKRVKKKRKQRRGK